MGPIIIRYWPTQLADHSPHLNPIAVIHKQIQTQTKITHMI